MLWETKLPARNFLIQIFVRCASEGELAAKHSIEQNASCPDISRRSNVFFFHYNFGAHVRRRAAEDFQFDVIGRAAAETKVDYFYTVLH